MDKKQKTIDLKQLSRTKMFKLLFLFLFTFSSLPIFANSSSIGGKRVIGYYIEWGGYSRKFYTDQIEAGNWTHINFSFIKPTWDATSQTGGVTFADSYASIEANWLNQFTWDETPKGHIGLLKKLKAANPNLKLIFSVGGWTMSHAFPEIAASANGRTTFAAACKKLLDTYGFDGIELDWEYPIKGGTDGTEYVNGILIPAQTYKPNNEDATNMVDLSKAIRAAIGTKELSIAMSPYLYCTYPSTQPRYVLPNNKASFGRTDDLTDYLDYINLMTYDYGGTWNSKTAINAPLYYSGSNNDENPSLYNVSSAVGKVLEAGVPAGKLNMGVPFYGRLYDGVATNNLNGMFVPWDKTREQGTWDVGVQSNEYSAVISYGDLVEDAGANATARISHPYLPNTDFRQTATGSGFTRYWNDATKTPYMYNPKTGIVIDYDDPQSIAEKVRFGLAQGLGGFMAWEISQDGRNTHTLSRTLMATILAKKIKINLAFNANTPIDLKGIKVTIKRIDDTIEKDSVLTDNTSANFLLPNGLDYKVTFSKTNYVFMPSTIDLRSLEQESTLNITVGDTPCTASGICKDNNGVGITGVNMGIYNGSTLIDTQITDANGNFKFNNLVAGVAVSVKPVGDSSFDINPTTYDYTLTSTPRTDLNFICTRKAGGINISLDTPIAGVIITAQNTANNETATTTTDATGKATFNNLKAGYDYVITAIKNNITFTNPSQTITLTSNTVNVVFNVDPSIVITGVVMFNKIPQVGKPVQIVGEWTSNDLGWFSINATTDANGRYTFKGIKNGYAKLVLSLNSWEYTNPSIPSTIITPVTLTNPKGYNEVNFTDSPIGKTINGFVTIGGNGISGATVDLYNSSNVKAQSTITNAIGAYSFQNIVDGTYTIKVSKSAAYTFTPATSSVTVASADVTVPAITATIDSRTYNVTVNTVDANNVIVTTPITEVNLLGTDLNITKSTIEGTTVFTLPIYSSFTATASANGYSFVPTNASITSLAKDETLNFKAIKKTMYTISTTITNSATNAALPGVTVTLSMNGKPSQIASSDSNGKVSFPNIEEGSTGSISYYLQGYVFTNADKAISAMAANLDLTNVGRKSSFTPLPSCAVIGYWHGWIGSGDLKAKLKLSEVSPTYNTLIVSFVETPAIGVTGYGYEPVLNVDYNGIYGSKQAFIDDIKAVKAKGIPVLFSIGGQNGHIELKTPQQRDAFVSGLKSIIDEYGFDGFDIDFEGGSMSFFSDLSAPLTSWDYSTLPAGKLRYTIDAVRSLCDNYGDDFILTAAPETFYVQVGYGSYGGTGLPGSFLPVIDNLRDKLDILQVQLYNTGSVVALDGKAYNQATPDFIVSMTDMLLKGFKAGTNGPNFAPLRQDQVAIGIPSNPSAAPAGGYLSPADGTKAYNYLKNRMSYNGGYSLTTSYPNLRGVMTWSVNWDESLNGRGGDETRRYEFGKTYSSLCGNPSTGNESITANSNKFRISPNPNDGTFTLEFDEPTFILAIHIYDMAGNNVYSEELDGSKSITSKRFNNLPLSPNTYCVVLDTDKGLISNKMITIK